jgi:hypothetical protein
VSTTGDDANDGGSSSPLRTFGAAMQRVQPHQHVAFADGTWGLQTTGDDFTQQIPVDVVVEKSIPNTTVVFNGGGTASLTFAGTGGLRDVTIAEFEKPLAASSGKPAVSNVTFKNSMGSLQIGGSAELACSSCTFEDDGSKVIPLVIVQDHARLDLENAHFDDLAFALIGVELRDFASLYTNGGSFAGVFQNAVRAFTGGTVSLLNTRFSGTAYNIIVVGSADRPTAQLRIEGCKFDGAMQLAAPIRQLRIRSSTIGSVLIAGNDQAADLGFPGDAGANYFKRTDEAFSLPYLGVSGWGNVVHATGNTWRANEQGSNDEGRYTAPVFIFQGESGVNVQVSPDATDGGGRPLSRVEL